MTETNCVSPDFISSKSLLCCLIIHNAYLNYIPRKFSFYLISNIFGSYAVYNQVMKGIT